MGQINKLVGDQIAESQCAANHPVDKKEMVERV